jgi:NADH dehydrogenase
MQTDVYELIANEKNFAKVSVDLFTYCSGFDGNISFYKQEVCNIDFNNKKVITDTQRLSYDYLVIAVGARTKFVKSIQGLKEHSHGLKRYKKVGLHVNL